MLIYSSVGISWVFYGNMYIGGWILPLDLLDLEEFFDAVRDKEHDFFFVGMRF